MTVFGRASSILVLGTNMVSAQLAELVDALVSGTSVRKYVQVRVLFWALFHDQAQVAELVDALG